MAVTDQPSYLENFLKTVEVVHDYISSPRQYGTDEFLYMREAHFLRELKDGPCEMGVLSTKLKITNGAASQTAARLEKKGLVERQPSSQDNRVIICKLTKKAKAIVKYHEKLDKDNFLNLHTAMSEYSHRDINAFFHILATLDAFFSDKTPLDQKK